MRALVPIFLALVPSAALAQQGFQFVPSATVAAVYDDDLAPAGAGAAAAFLTELSPRIALGYGTARFSLLARGELDAELFDTAPTQTSPFLNGTGGFQLGARLTDRLTLSADGTFIDTNTPRALDVATGFDPGAVREEAGALDASLELQLDSRWRATLKGTFASTSELGLVTDEEALRAGVQRQLSQLDRVRLELGVRHFSFGEQLNLTTAAPLAGWERKLSPTLDLTLLAGPRFDGRSLDGVEGLAELAWQRETFHLSFTLQSTQNAVAGFVGLVDTASAGALLVYRPDARTRLGAAPAGYLSYGDPLHARVFELRLDAARALTRWLSVVASYRLTAQHATYAQAALVADSSVHNQLVLGVSFSAPAQPGMPDDAPGSVTAWTQPGSLSPP